MTGPAWYPGALAEPLDQSDGADYGGPLTTSHGLVLHVQVGNNDLRAYFDQPDVQASSHWWVSKYGAVSQYVPATSQSWAQSAGNSGWHSVETEGTPDQPLTDAQIATLGRLMAWGHQAWGWPLQLADTTAGTGLGWHGMGGSAWGSHPNCPGDLRKAQRADILAAAGGQSTGDDVTLDDIRQAVRDVFNEATAQGQRSGAGTIVADLTADQADYNLDAGQTAALARIEALLGSLPGGSGGPLTAGQILNALPGLVRQDLAAVVVAGVQLLAAPA